MGGSNESCHSLKMYRATFKQHYFRTSKIIFRCFRCGWKNLSTHITVRMCWCVFYGLVFLKECAFQILFSSYELFTAEKIPLDIQLKYPRNASKEDFKKSSLLSLKYRVSLLFILLYSPVIAPEIDFCSVFTPLLHQSHFLLSLKEKYFNFYRALWFFPSQILS